MRNLPLVVPNKPELGQHAHVFLQWKYLPKSPLHGARLTRCYVGATLLPVDFPVSGQVCGGSLVLGDVEGGATGNVVAPISGTYVIAGSRGEAPGGSHESVPRVEIHPLSKVPAEIQRLDVHVGKARTASRTA